MSDPRQNSDGMGLFVIGNCGSNAPPRILLKAVRTSQLCQISNLD
jgi:hypothetical protein